MGHYESLSCLGLRSRKPEKYRKTRGVGGVGSAEEKKGRKMRAKKFHRIYSFA